MKKSVTMGCFSWILYLFGVVLVPLRWIWLFAASISWVGFGIAVAGWLLLLTRFARRNAGEDSVQTRGKRFRPLCIAQGIPGKPTNTNLISEVS
jgi:hypothetical protein